MNRSTLENGMRVVIDASANADAAAVYVWINAGSSAEPAGMEGAAHFLEHMVFKGTRSYGVGEVAAAIEDLGGDLNAWTAFDETVFHATVPGAAATAALAVLAEMLREARLDAEELERERGVVLEEIRGGQDDPDLVVSEATWARAFPGHPYGRPIIGYPKTVRGISRDALKAWYEANYQPSNACLVVCGRIDPAEVAEAAGRLFAGGGRSRAVRPAPPTPGRGAHRLRRSFEARLVELGYVGPELGHPDVPALDVLTTALGGGPSAPLEARLRLRESLCIGVGMGYEAEVAGGLAAVSLHLREGRAEEAVAAAREEVDRARRGELPMAAIERAKAQIVADRVFGRETVDGRAHALAFDMERCGDPEAWRAYEAAILAVSPATASEAARRWLAPEREVSVALLPDGERVGRARPRASVALAPARAYAASRLDNGVRVLLEPSDGEVVAVRVGGVGGQLHDRAATAGRAGAWARLATRGTEDLDAVAFAEEVELLAGGLGASASRSTQWLRGEFVAGNFMPGLELFLEALLRPAFAEEDVARMREEMLAALDERDDAPDVLAAERVWALGVGAHPYGLPPSGTKPAISRLDRRALVAMHRRWLRADNLVVTVAGAFDPSRVLSRLRRALGRIPAGFVSPVGRPVRWPASTQRARLRCGRDQAHLAVAWPGVRVTDPDEPAAEVLAAVLGGQGGRLFLELREELGLAYSVGASSLEGLDPGLVVCHVATDPARLDEAEQRLLSAVARLGAEPPTTEEVERVKRYLVGASEMDMQTAGARATAMALAAIYGLDPSAYRSIPRTRVGAVTPAAVAAFAARVLERPLAVVGVTAAS